MLAKISLRAAVAACTLAGAVLRVVSLRALPVFGDEAIFLRMATVLRGEPARRLWISLREAQVPPHKLRRRAAPSE